ncbi:hypothetical protein K443DRAFT_124497 [Laccaria amethystina LaAM-08-1]|uniref:Uncharacterized protein n=1 Tax=Laccaria amethystina LaAM-08-1 TaxID=1095629 RepID=A0A0C9XF84_9AGAR|nr:hypothetical protein K443DRAFT_124497 [Laccaria amethystina LaAM-08-1]
MNEILFFNQDCIQMAHLNTSKVMDKFRRSEIWRTEKVERTSSTSATIEEDVVSDTSTLDELSDSDEEVVSGSAQTACVYNMGELAHVLDEEVSDMKNHATGSLSTPTSTRQVSNEKQWPQKQKHVTAEQLAVKSLKRGGFLVEKAQTTEVTFPSFSFAEAISLRGHSQRIPSGWMVSPVLA